MMRERNELTLIFPLSPSGFEMWYRTPSKSAHRNRIRHNDVISGPSQTQNVPATVTSMLSGLGLKRNSIKILRVFSRSWAYLLKRWRSVSSMIRFFISNRIMAARGLASRLSLHHTLASSGERGLYLPNLVVHSAHVTKINVT